MMLIKIALTVFYAALALPTFPYCFFGMREDFLSDSKSNLDLDSDSDFLDSKKEMLLGDFLVILFVIFIGGSSIIMSCLVFTEYDGRQLLWYMYILPIACPLFWQFIWACNLLKRKLLPIVLPVLVVLFLFSIFIPSKNAILSYKPINTGDKAKSSYIEMQTIKTRFEADTVSYQGYKNGKYIYTLDGETNGLGVLFIEISSSTTDTFNKESSFEVIKDGYTIEETISFTFYPCKYEYSILGHIRDNYKTEEIVSLGIVLNNQTPYGKFGILKRDGFFERPHVDSYLLLNMVNGEITQYYEKSLPQFARN